jgi:hypothetical protein
MPIKQNQVSENITIQAVPTTDQPATEFSLAGHALIAKEGVPNPLGTGDFPNQTKLLFSRNGDGADVIKYGCNLCLTILPTSQGVGIHIGRIHNENKVKFSKQYKALDPLEQIIRAVELLKATKTEQVNTKDYEKLIVERDHWKREAQKAKRKLEQIRSAIAPQV